MKLKDLYIIVIGIIIISSSCEEIKLGDRFLEKPPSVSISKDTIFSRGLYAERFLWGAYTTLPFITNEFIAGGYDYTDGMTDIIQSPSPGEGLTLYHYVGNMDASLEDNNKGKYRWKTQGGWQGVRKALIFIANIDRVPDISTDYKRQLKAEAMMIMAVHYTQMYRHYGGLPWESKDLPINEIDQFPRLTSLATLDSIVALCDKAAVDLPWIVTDPATWEGRMTKAGAMGLKARILLFAASPIFNSSTPYLDGEAAQKRMSWHGGYDPNLWKRAADAAHELIVKAEKEGGYTILSTGNPRSDFREGYHYRNKGEILIAVRRGYTPGTGFEEYKGCAANYTQEYVDMFPMADGKPITDPTSGYNENDPYINRDPRLYETVLVNGDIFNNRPAEMWIGGRERPDNSGRAYQSGYARRKFSHDFINDLHWQSPYLRLPEIYLSYAEAQNEFNNGPDAEAYRCINVVRRRAGLGDLPSGLSKEQFRSAILTERACEFGMEDVRWHDIVRWKRDDILKMQLHGMDITKSGNVLTYTKFMLPKRAWSVTWSPKWYLSAFPYSEILKNYGLVQNPGWEL